MQHSLFVLNLFKGANPILKVAVPVAAIAGVVAVSRARHFSLRYDLGLVRPPLLPLLLWLAVLLAWMLGTDFVLNWRGPFDFTPWKEEPGWVSAARVLGVGLLGPLAEELVVRGLVFARLQRAGLPMAAVVGLTAAGWAVVHVDYSAAVIFIIFILGIFLALARRYTGSLWVPVLMHMTWNLYAVW